MIPIIILLSTLLIVVLLTLFTLGVDLVEKGCLAWHRDSLGYLFQVIIATICLLVTSCHLMHYIESYEHIDDFAKSKWNYSLSVILTFVYVYSIYRVKCHGMFRAIARPFGSLVDKDHLLPCQELHYARSDCPLCRFNGICL